MGTERRTHVSGGNVKLQIIGLSFQHKMRNTYRSTALGTGLLDKSRREEENYFGNMHN